MYQEQQTKRDNNNNFTNTHFINDKIKYPRTKQMNSAEHCLVDDVRISFGFF